MESQGGVEGGGADHFDDKVWLELARQVVTPDRAAQMRAHLNAGCESCLRRYAMWCLAVETAEREAEYEPPEDAVRAVQGAFPFFCKLPLIPRLAEVARLVFDSFCEPLPVGVRGAPSPEVRHVLYESGDVVIDVRLENESHSITSVAGQVLQKNAPVETTAGAAIVLVQGADDFIARTIADCMGEFQLQYEHDTEVTLFIGVPGGRILSVALPVA
jgi:hypothetical protein